MRRLPIACRGGAVDAIDDDAIDAEHRGGRGRGEAARRRRSSDADQVRRVDDADVDVPRTATAAAERRAKRARAPSAAASPARTAAVADATARAAARWPRTRGSANQRAAARGSTPEHPTIAWRGSTSRRPSTTRTAIRTSATRYEKIGADAIARYQRLRGDDVYFLMGLDEHGQKVAQAAAERGVSPQAFVDDIAARFEAMWARLSISHDRFIRTTRAAPQARRQGADRANSRAQPRRLLREDVRGLVLRRLRAVQARERDRRRQVRPASDARAQWTTERNWFFRLTTYQDFLSAALRRAPGVPPARVAAQRDSRAARAGARGHLHHALAAVVGDSLPASARRRRDAGHVGVVRRAAELSHGDRLPRRRVRDALAGAAPRHRQGHHAPALRGLAGDAAGGRAAAARAVWAHGFVQLRRRAVQQVRRACSSSSTRRSTARRRRVPLFPPSRSAVRRRRRFLVGALRRNRRRRLRQRRPSRPVRHPLAVLRPLPQPGRRDVRGRHRARPAWAATATGRPRRPSPTSTATATSTSTSATTSAWDADHPRLCRDPTTRTATVLRPARRSTPLPDHVFRNDGGRFVDVTAEAGIVDRDGRGLGVVAADLDDDGRVDLFVANDMTANYLFRNLGGFRFEEVGPRRRASPATPSGGYQAGMGVACGDLDGDGRPDLAVTNFYGESTTFYQQPRRRPLRRPRPRPSAWPAPSRLPAGLRRRLPRRRQRRPARPG